MLDLKRYSALELSEKIVGGEIKTGELVNLICEKEDSLNAYISRDMDYALKQAEDVQKRIDSGEVRSRLAGVPIAIKDNICTKGIATTCASKMLFDFIPPYDAMVIKKLKAADMIILGKTNMDEFAMGSTGETSHFKSVKNPYDLNRAAGGSSSGSAAAVANGNAIIALGSDTGGSVRMPCSYCGLVGLKPTYGAVSRYGLIAYASSLDTIGITAKSVLDTAALFDIIKGKDEHDSTSCDSDKVDFEYLKSGDLKGKRVAVLESENAAVKSAESKLEALGAETVDIDFSMLKYAIPTYYIIACAEASSNLARYDSVRYGYRAESAETLNDLFVNSRSEGFGFEVKKRIMLGTYVLSAGYFDEYYIKALKVRNLIIDEFKRLFSEYDFILSPVTEGEAPLLGKMYNSQTEKYNADIYNVCANLAGLPALALPEIKGENGLPVGVQLIGKPFSENELFMAGYALETSK